MQSLKEVTKDLERWLRHRRAKAVVNPGGHPYTVDILSAEDEEALREELHAAGWTVVTHEHNGKYRNCPECRRVALAKFEQLGSGSDDGA